MDSETSRNASGDRENSPSRQGEKAYQCHTVEQIQCLESYLKECSSPDDNQREELSKELGFKKTQHVKEDNCTLRSEHEKLLSENHLALREAMKGTTAYNHVGPGNESTKAMQELRIENARLKEQIKNQVTHPNPQPGITYSDEPEETPQQAMSRTVRDLDKNTVLEIAASAMNELVELLSTTEPVWVTSSDDGRCVLHRDTYEKIFPVPSSSSPLKPTNARIESSKDSAQVAISAAELARLLSDPDGNVSDDHVEGENHPNARYAQSWRLSALVHDLLSHTQLYEKIHVLSPHVAAREFILIRYCRQLSSNAWAIADVSFDLFKRVPEASPVRSWKFPSGCVIEDTSDGKSNVTWVEHVHVDDNSQNHRLYRDLVRSGRAYGAERWIAALRTMCERSASSNGSISPLHQHELEWVVATVEGRKNMMRLSHRMVKDFNDALNMSDEFDFPQMCELHNMTGVRVSMRRSDGPARPDGLVIAMATSLWLPFSVDFLFNFFNDDAIRAKWDVLANGNPMKSIARISTGTHEGCSVAFMQPHAPNENKMSILQETVVDSLGASLVYAPIEIRSIDSIVNVDEDNLMAAEILPSGIVISSDGRVKKGEAEASSSKANNDDNSNPDGSLVTIAFQILASRGERPKGLSMETVATVHSLISSTVQNIREALDQLEE